MFVIWAMQMLLQSFHSSWPYFSENNSFSTLYVTTIVFCVRRQNKFKFPLFQEFLKFETQLFLFAHLFCEELTVRQATQHLCLFLSQLNGRPLLLTLFPFQQAHSIQQVRFHFSAQIKMFQHTKEDHMLIHNSLQFNLNKLLCTSVEFRQSNDWF